jgi:hypothetical protein
MHRPIFVIAAIAAVAAAGTIPLTFLPLDTGAACLDGSPYGPRGLVFIY